MSAQDEPTTSGSEKLTGDWHRQVAHSWAEAVGETVYVPMSAQQLDEFLLDLVELLVGALAADEFSTTAGNEVARKMVAAKFTGHETLQRSVEVLGTGLLGGGDPPDERLFKVVSLLGAMASSYSDAIRLWTLEQQEEVKRALLNATVRTEAELRATENRFREVFVSAATGIAITDLDGNYHQTNPGLADIVGSSQRELAKRTLGDLFTESSRPIARDAYRQAADAGADRFSTKAELVKDNGDTVWAVLNVSMLRDDDGNPAYYVTMVQDLSEIKLLQGQLEKLSSRDALTGLSNRQYFRSRLETVLGQARPGEPMTLIHVDLDNFATVNRGFGHEAGDRLLEEVTKKLQAVFAGEKVEIGRIDGDEFAILVENTERTPSTPELIEMIGESLAEPVYLNGTAVAIGASVGAVGRLWSTDGDEMFRAAESALRKAKRSGKRQWSEFDKDEDARERTDFVLAGTLAGAWENGELEVVYQPVFDPATGVGTGVQAMLSWHRDGSDPLPHKDCVHLAELIGLSIQLGPWLMREACERLPLWQAMAGRNRAVLQVRLTPAQCADADLVAAVNRAMDVAATAPELLEVAFDTATVARDLGDTADNLSFIAANGIGVALHSFHGGPTELALLSRGPARSVVLADPFGETRPDELPADSVLRKATVDLVAMLRDLGIVVGVDNVRTASEAAFWADTGVHTAQGEHFGGPADLHDVMASFGNR